MIILRSYVAQFGLEFWSDLSFYRRRPGVPRLIESLSGEYQ